MVEGHLEVGLGPLGSRADERLHGRAQQATLGRETQGLRVPGDGTHDRHALLRRWKTHTSVLLTHRK
jgi:hypothetical protein